MRKKIFGRQLSRDANERKALFRELMNELVLHESITTTEAKARAIRSKIEKLVTKAKKKEEKARQFIQPYLSSQAVEKLLKEIAPRFAQRPGGYVRIIKLTRRFSDNASMAIIEWVEKKEKEVKKAVAKPVKEEKTVESTVVDAEIVAEKEEKPKKKVTKAKKETK